MLTLTACTFRTALPDGGEGDGGAEPGDFIATAEDFANYTSWTPTTEVRSGPGALQALIESAHMVANMDVTRRAYANATALAHVAGREHAPGSIYVKEMRRSDGTLLGMAAMVKRGGGFNALHRGWEWFALRADGSIANRGVTLEPDCNSCHTRSSGGDYVFTR